jgi:response regulator RpfG family c-di-GMP phosphodiesterase
MAQDTKHTILIVDDEPTNVAILNAMLNCDYKIKVALSGPDALKIAIGSASLDLILLDVVMDDMDGFEVCKKLKANNQTSQIPVIFVTSLNDVKRHREGIELGAIDFFEKPFSAPLIKKRIENHLAAFALPQIKATHSAHIENNTKE